MAFSYSTSDKTTSLTVSRMPEGGFLVTDGYLFNGGGMPRFPRFAATSIDEAVKYCKRKLETEHADGSKN